MRTTGLLEGTNAVPIDLALQPRFSCRLLDQVHRPREQIGDPVPHTDHVEEGELALWREPYGKVDVRARNVFSASDRSEEGQAIDPRPAQFGLVGLDRVQD